MTYTSCTRPRIKCVYIYEYQVYIYTTCYRVEHILGLPNTHEALEHIERTIPQNLLTLFALPLSDE